MTDATQRYGQIVIGAPGSGKTTYCHALSLYFKTVQRDCVLVNLDPANETAPFEWNVDIFDLISVEETMEELNLGPNGSLIYAMDFLKTNISWLIEKLQSFKKTHRKEGEEIEVCPYFIFDMPGQVELFSNSDILSQILSSLTKELNFNFVTVSLTDVTCILETSKFFSSIFLSLTSMLQNETAFIHVLNKCQLLPKLGKPKF